MITFLVRHGDAGDKGSWDGPDAGRPLSPAGLDQAEGLVLRLEDYPVERILCSPTVRCHQTVQPLARDRLLPIERIAALGVDAGPAEVLAQFWDGRLRDAVLCTHGETIGRLLSQLVADGLVAMAPLQWPKGSTWLLQRTAPATGPCPLFGSVGTWRPCGSRLAPSRSNDGFACAMKRDQSERPPGLDLPRRNLHTATPPAQAAGAVSGLASHSR